MGLDVDSIQPTPSDFADFVFCGAKWALNKNRSLDSFKKAKILSYDNTKGQGKHNNLAIGQQNESRCIDWVMNKHSISSQQIVYNGTGESKSYLLTSQIESLGIDMQCKPDLIISKDNRNLLFEFKAVMDDYYLVLDEFDSIHAQVWCYTNLKEMKIDEYYLLRYFIDPFKNSSTKYKKLTPYELNPSKFERLFEQYIKTIETLKEIDLEMRKNKKIKSMGFDMFNKPKDEKEKYQKCYHCIYKTICEPEFEHQIYY